MNIEEIQTQFNKVILHSQDYDEVNTDVLFERWYDAKRWFIERNNGELIFEIPDVTFELDTIEKKRKISSFIEYVAEYNGQLAEFLFCNVENFYNNRTTEDFQTRNGKVVPKGMKISRAFRFFEEDKEKIDHWQTKMSMMLQEDKINGTLCFSVHPLDFLSSSENTYNWRSCHALDGEYRAGNLSYMLDESTIICYLKGEEDARLPRFPADVPWNNKKWRMLLFFSDSHNALFAGRQYPFFAKEALPIILQNLRENRFVVSSGWSNWTNTRISRFKYDDEWTDYLNDNFICMSNVLYGMRELVKDGKNSLHFNDLLNSSVYVPYYCWTEYNRWGRIPSEREVFNVGAEVPCLRCGKEHISLSGSFLCDEHELMYGTCEDDDVFCYCDHCGNRMLIEHEDTHRLRDGEWVCSICLDMKCAYCECCGEYVWNHDIIYDAKKDRYICNECYEWQ